MNQCPYRVMNQCPYRVMNQCPYRITCIVQRNSVARVHTLKLAKYCKYKEETKTILEEFRNVGQNFKNC